MATKKPKPPPPPRTTQALVYANYSPYPPANEWAFQSAAPNSQPVAQGYDANAPRIQGVRRAAAVNQTNARLIDGTGSSAYQMSIFVSYVGIDTALSGSSAQSQLSRDFYPRNFVQPNFVVRGWSLDQQDYGLLCEFVHRAQHKSVSSNTPTQLHVFGRNTAGKGLQRGYDGRRKSGGKVTLSRPGVLMPHYKSDPPVAPDGTFFNQLFRGAHQEVLCQGYVLSMPRQHRQYQAAVAWQFSFTVTTMLKGIYSEPAGITVSQGKTWADILADSKALGVVSVSAQENKAALAFAAQHAATIFNQTSSSSSGGAGSGSGGSGSVPSTGTLSKQQIEQAWTQAGGNPASANIAAAVALAESKGSPTAHCLNCAGVAEDSRGLWQINVGASANPQYASENLYDPVTCAKAAVAISGNGSNWGPWSTYNSGAYRAYL